MNLKLEGERNRRDNKLQKLIKDTYAQEKNLQEVRIVINLFEVLSYILLLILESSGSPASIRRRPSDESETC